MKKKIREIWMIFDLAYNPGGWLILYAVLKNGVAEGVTSDPHDT